MLWRDPNFLWLLVGVATVAVVLGVALRRRAVLLGAFAEEKLVDRLAPDVDARRGAWRVALRVVALALLVIALAGPKWGFQWQEVRREGIDLIAAIDTSRSMLATDVKPNRLERAKLAVLDLLPMLGGDRVGLVAFAGTAFLEAPLTLDYAAFERSLRSLQVGIIPRGGTALARAIQTSVDALEARQGKYEALILITDGEDHEGDVAEAAKLAAGRGIKIFTVGIGTSEGELLPLGEGGQGFVKDRQGQVVKSRLNEETLQEIAAATGGAYVRGVGPVLGLDEVFRDHIAKMERREVDSTLERRYEDRFQIPLGLGLALLALEALVRQRRPAPGGRRRWLRRRNRGRGTASGQAARQRLVQLALLLLLPTLVGWLDRPENQAAEGNRLYEAGKYDEAVEKYGEGLVDEPASSLLQFNLSTALYRQGKYNEAIGSLTKLLAEGGSKWTARSAYNLGNAHYRVGAGVEASDPQAAIASYEQALVAYKRAMAADAADVDAKFNHEFVAQKLSELKKRLEEEQEQKDKQQKDKQQKDEQQKDEQQKDKQQKDEQQKDKQQKDEQQKDEQQKEEQDQGEGQGKQEQEQKQEQKQEQEQTAGEEQEEKETGQESGPSQEPQREEAEQQMEQAQAGGNAQQPEDVPQDADEQAAQAVLDTARGEELGPQDIERPVGIAGMGEPLHDW